MRRSRIAAAAAAALALSSLLPAAADQPAARPAREGLSPCRVPGLDEDVLCGTVAVPEDRSVAGGRTIALKVVVLPATGAPAAADALAYLAGGGVLPATRYAARFARSLAGARRERDILLVDQRGTGGSDRLGCPPAASQDPPHRRAAAYFAEVAGCRDELARRADLRCYTSAAAADDLDAVRARLGYDRLTLYGMSYGSKLAQVYLRRHPGRVRAVVMHGPMPVDAPMWQELPREAQRGLDRVLDACAADAACGAAFPRLREELAATLARLASAPVAVAAEGPAGPVTVTVDDVALRLLLLAAQGSSRTAARIPAVIHAAHGGDYAEIAQVAAETPPDDGGGVPKGLFLSLLCSESMPQVDAAALRREAAATFNGAWMAEKPLGECALWPRAELPRDFWEPVRSRVPSLVLVGELDSTTPPRYAEQVARGLAAARVVVLPGRGHNDVDECVTGLIERFVAAGDAARLDASCAQPPRPLQFVTRAAPPPAAGGPTASPAR